MWPTLIAGLGLVTSGVARAEALSIAECETRTTRSNAIVLIGQPTDQPRVATDLSLGQDAEPGFELVRYYNPAYRGPRSFGAGWQIAIPVQLRVASDRQRRFANALIPERLTIEHLLDGRSELLVFRAPPGLSAAYVPNDARHSGGRHVSLYSDGSFRLAGGAPEEFHFDPRGYLSEVLPVAGNPMRYEYDVERGFRRRHHPVRPTGCLLDVDASGGRTNVGTDIVYIARRLLGFIPVPPNFRPNPNIPSDEFIAARVDAVRSFLDVDGNGAVNVGTDIVHIARRLLGFIPVPPNFRPNPSILSDEFIAANVDALCP